MSLNWVEISQANLAHNIKQFKNFVPDAAIWPVIKSNAYGHGLEQVAGLLEHNEHVAGLMVVNLEEALFLSQITSKPVMVLSYFDRVEEQLRLAAKQKISLPIYDLDTADYLNNLNEKFLVNIKIDTGTSRLGFRAEDSIEAIKQIQAKQNLEINSLFTHFAESESEDQIFTQEQYKIFKKITDQFPDIKKHAVCSAACISQLQAQGDIIRLGISLYGLWPSAAAQEKGQAQNINLKPVLSWKTKIIQIKNLSAGETVGYNRTYKCQQNCKIAILPVGYNEGYARALSNQAEVLIRGQRFPVRGNICMNLTMIELPQDTDIKTGEVVTLLGQDQSEYITAEELAGLAKTINYEIVTSINLNLPRIVI
jgi:alanine racemase